MTEQDKPVNTPREATVVASEQITAFHLARSYFAEVLQAESRTVPVGGALEWAQMTPYRRIELTGVFEFQKPEDPRAPRTFYTFRLVEKP